MNMKHLLLPALFGAAALVGTLPLSAATQVATYAEAEAKGLLNDDGIIFFAYADGWDNFSKKRCEKLMASEAILKAAGKAVLLPVPIPEYWSEECQKQREAICGKIGVPGSGSYPAIIMVTREGKHYATLYGKDVARGKVSTVAKLIADRMAKGKKRAGLLAAAENCQGPEKAKMIFDAYQLEGLTGFGKGFAGHIAKFDPQNSTGAPRGANFFLYGFMDLLYALASPELVKLVDRHLADPAYTDRQRQQICVAAIGVLRRRSGAEHATPLRLYAERMKAYAPETAEGQAADFILSNWVKELSCSEGWSPSCLPADKRPVELRGKLPIDGPGTYTVTFRYTSGKWALTVLAVELYDGKTKVAEDHHTGTAGGRHQNNVYTLKVAKAVKDPHIFITFNMPDNRDSYGTITIEKQ